MIKVIAFDFFDTLVHRNCLPETVLFQWAREMSVKLDFRIPVKVLYEKRKFADLPNNGIEKEECSYSELMDYLYDSICNRIKGISREVFVAESYATELKIELEHLFVDNDNCHLLKKYAEKYPIVLVSDFYCPVNFFCAILKHFDLLKYINKIYVSSEIGKRKSTGNLYEYVIKDLGVCANEVLMIGDNEYSDHKLPRRKGIQTRFRPNRYHVNEYREMNIKYLIKKAYRKNLFTGYSGVVLLFLEKLYKSSIQNKIDKLLFCSREGQNLLYLFNEYQKRLYPHCLVKTEYFYVSRRSTLLPSLAPIEKETFAPIFRQYTELPVFDFLYSIGFSEDEIEKICSTVQITSDLMISDSNDCVVLDLLKKSEYFVTLYNKKRVDEKIKFLSYVKQFIGESKNVYLVDIGWKGTIQDNIKETLGNDYSLCGYYFGLNEYSCSYENNQKQGLIFDTNNRSTNLDVFSYGCIHLERVFAANHGQTIGYSQNRDVIEPVISTRKEDVEIFEYVKDYQRLMNQNIIELMNILSTSKYEVSDWEPAITEAYLSFLMKEVPKKYKVFLDFRKKVRENFGIVSKTKVRVTPFFFKDKEEKKKFFYVDYAYRILDKFHLKLFYPLAWIYCNLAYIIKRFQIKQ